MNKKHIIRFLKERKRGSYTLLVRMYADLVSSMSIRMALDLIKEDLWKESGESVELHYFSLARAISRFKKKSGVPPASKVEFLDAHQIKEGQSSIGRFKVPATKVKNVQ